MLIKLTRYILNYHVNIHVEFCSNSKKSHSFFSWSDFAQQWKAWTLLNAACSFLSIGLPSGTSLQNWHFYCITSYTYIYTIEHCHIRLFIFTYVLNEKVTQICSQNGRNQLHLITDVHLKPQKMVLRLILNLVCFIIQRSGIFSQPFQDLLFSGRIVYKIIYWGIVCITYFLFIRNKVLPHSFKCWRIVTEKYTHCCEKTEL